jgi:hypothetical protein
MVETKNAYKILVGEPEEKRSIGMVYLHTDGRIILKWILKV